MQVSGKTILLTGGTNGIGREMADQLKTKGANVITTGRNPERVAEMREKGFEVIEADLSDGTGVDALVAAVDGKDIDVLINNAGQLADHDFRASSPDADVSDAAVYSNLSAPIRLIVGLMEKLKARPEAAIVNVTSGLAISPAAGSPVYCATKSGLRFYTLGLREQLKDTNIHVIEALPPVVDTQMNDGRDAKKMSPQECARQIVEALETNANEANIGMTKALRVLEGIHPSLARRMTLKF
ncbi:MAG: SDR family NAD(P)-dependent oxidoreductase [Pseudomonadota bacterium]